MNIAMYSHNKKGKFDRKRSSKDEDKLEFEFRRVQGCVGLEMINLFLRILEKERSKNLMRHVGETSLTMH